LTALAQRYMRAETTEAEERELERIVLTAKELPAELEPLRQMMTALHSRDSLFTERELDEMLRGDTGDSDERSAEPQPEGRRFSWLRVAAVAAIVLCLSGLAWAFFAPKSQKTEGATTQTVEQRAEQTPDEVRFDDVELDSILGVVARHYGCSVRFRQDDVRRQRLMLTWRRDEPIDEFVASVNMFDAVRLTIEGDTIVVTRAGEGYE